MRRMSLIDSGQPPGQVVAAVITALDNENNDSGAALHQRRSSLRHLQLAQQLRLVAYEQSPRRSSPRGTTGQQQKCDQRQKKEEVEMPASTCTHASLLLTGCMISFSIRDTCTRCPGCTANNQASIAPVVSLRDHAGAGRLAAIEGAPQTGCQIGFYVRNPLDADADSCYTHTHKPDVNDREREEYAPGRGSANRRMVRGRCRRRCGMGPGVAERTGNVERCPQ